MELNSEYLLTLARDKTRQGRNELSHVISDLFENEESVLSDHEKSMMFGIMHGLIREVESSVRKQFSLLLASRDDTPSSLILDLANDDIEVAYPVLTQSTVLQDTDLIKIIQNRASEHQLAITLRHDVSENVSDALVEDGDEDVITSLLNNSNAKISETSMTYLVEQSKRYDSFQDPLLHRDELSEVLAKKMFTWVSDALRTQIISRYDVPQDVVSELIEQSIRNELNGDKKISASGLKNLVHVLGEENMVSPNIIMAALNDGEVHLFLSLFSQSTGLNEEEISKVIFDHDTAPVTIACKAIGFNIMQFGILLKKKRKRTYTNSYEKEDERQAALDLFRNIARKDALDALNMWKTGDTTTKLNSKAHAV